MLCFGYLVIVEQMRDTWRDPHARRRGGAVVLTALIEGVLIYILMTGSTAAPRAVDERDVKTFDVVREAPPPERVRPRKSQSKRAEGAASPPNIRSKATEVVALPPIIQLPVPPPIVTAPVAATGRDASSGASDIRGLGTGSGGIGNGTGSGGAGDGDGGGGEETPPRWRKGRLKDSDYPSAAGEAGISGTVAVRYLVRVDGRVSNCEIMSSSGDAELDAVTCRLITERFRFDPSRDAAGRPVPAYLRENHSWVASDDPPAR